MGPGMATATAGNVSNTHAEAEARRQGSDWGEKLARAGYYGKGILYFVIGFLAAKAAFTTGGDVGGSKSALTVLAGEGFLGTALLWIIAIGLVGYAAWNAFRTAANPEHDSAGKRAFFAVSAVLHASLAVWVFTHLLGGGGGGSGGGSGGSQGLVATVLGWGTIGTLLVAAAGLAIIGFAAQQLIKAYKVDLSDMLDYGAMSARMRQLTTYVGRGGLAARGVVFSIVGFFFLTAAFQGDSSEAGRLGAAMQTLGSFGPWVLGIVAVGVACYGVYMVIKGRYRRIEV